MIVSTNILAVPTDSKFENFEKNGLKYEYKMIQQLNQADLVVEIITCDESYKVAYVSPDDFEDEATRLFLSSQIVNFLHELKIIDLPESSHPEINDLGETIAETTSEEPAAEVEQQN